MTSEEGRDDVGAAALEAVALLAGIAVPGFGILARRLARAVRVEHERRQSVALAAAEHLSGLTPEELAEQIANEPRLHPLLVRLLHAAGINGHDRTLRAMGAALGDAVRERDRIDECDLLLQSLDGLTAEHAAVLDVIGRPAPRGARCWSAPAVHETAGVREDAYPLLRASLDARGLTAEGSDGRDIMRMDGAVNPYVRLTSAGVIVLAVLREHHAEEGRQG